MICHNYEQHNHLLSEQDECLYCEINALDEQLQKGRDYLMQVEANKITVEDSLEAFGFGRNGLGGA